VCNSSEVAEILLQYKQIRTSSFLFTGPHHFLNFLNDNGRSTRSLTSGRGLIWRKITLIDILVNRIMFGKRNVGLGFIRTKKLWQNGCFAWYKVRNSGRMKQIGTIADYIHKRKLLWISHKLIPQKNDTVAHQLSKLVRESHVVTTTD